MEKRTIRNHIFIKPSIQAQSGQATVEYLFVLVLGVIAAVLFYQGTLAMYDQAVTNLGGRLEANLRSGRLPASQWAKEN